MSNTKQKFSTLKTGDRFSYCFEGDFTVSQAYQKDGKTVKITATPVNGGDAVTFGTTDADFINLLSL
jgi:hypothetical protein